MEKCSSDWPWTCHPVWFRCYRFRWSDTERFKFTFYVLACIRFIGVCSNQFGHFFWYFEFYGRSKESHIIRNGEFFATLRHFMTCDDLGLHYKYDRKRLIQVMDAINWRILPNLGPKDRFWIQDSFWMFFITKNYFELLWFQNWKGVSQKLFRIR